MANLSIISSPTLQCVATQNGKLLCEKAPEETSSKAPEQNKDRLKLSRDLLAPGLKGAGAGLIVGGAAGSLGSMAYNTAMGAAYNTTWYPTATMAKFGVVTGAATGAMVGAAVANLTDNVWSGAAAGAVTGFLSASLLFRSGPAAGVASIAAGAAGAAAGVAGALVASRK